MKWLARIAVVSAMCVLVGGCSGTRYMREKMYGPLTASKPCCSSFHEFNYAPLPQGKLEFEILTTDPTYNFETGKSFFKPFLLPERTQPQIVKISSFSNSLVGGFFQPDILILDREKNITQRIASPLVGQPLQRRPFMSAILSNEFELPADNARYAYLIVRTTDELLALRIPEQGTATLVAGNIYVPIVTHGFIVSWPAGELALELRAAGAK